jgi:hypothetical protein
MDFRDRTPGFFTIGWHLRMTFHFVVALRNDVQESSQPQMNAMIEAMAQPPPAEIVERIDHHRRWVAQICGNGISTKAAIVY